MSQAHSERDHATLAPSAAHQWMHCPGSVPFQRQFPDRRSKAADEGTAAHELAAHCLQMGFNPDRFLGRVIDIAGKDAATRFLAPGRKETIKDSEFLVDEDMANGVNGYVRLVRQHAQPPNRLLVEKRVHATAIHDECWGTGDAMVYDEKTRTLHIFDLKFGRGVVVEAERNPQLTIYAEGARGIFGNLPVEHVSMHIYQPRAPHPKGAHRTWTVPIEEHEFNVKHLHIRALKVDEAEDTFGLPIEDSFASAYLSAGDHCRFCKASATCPARFQEAQDVAASDFGVVGDDVPMKDPHRMDASELGRVLRFARRLQHWINDVEAHANAEALAGRMPAGFKLVEGRRGDRQWTDEERVVSMLPVLTDLDEADCMEPPAPPKLLSPAKLEKKLPPEQRAVLAGFTTQAPGKSALVPAEDPREPIRTDAASEFDVADLEV